MTISLHQDKVKKIVQQCQLMRKRRKMSVGRMTATTQAVLPAPLHFKEIQRLKNVAIKAGRSYDTVLDVSTKGDQKLPWLMEELQKGNGRLIHQKTSNLVIESDASLFGWGALADGAACGLQKKGSYTSMS